MNHEARSTPAVPSAGVEIRVARSDELTLIGDLTAAVYIAAGYSSPYSSYTPLLRDAASRARDAVLFVAIHNGETVGTVTYCRHGSSWAQLTVRGEAEFRMLAVAPAFRGLGLGEALVRHCVSQARADGCTTLRLSTAPVMHAAHRIYRRLGFTRTPGHDWQPQPDVDLLTYALIL